MGIATSVPLTHAPPTERTTYLRKVAGLTFVGLVLSSVTGLVSAGTIAVVPALASSGASLIIMLGAYAIAHFVARGMVFSHSATTRWLGFFTGSIFQGIAMGYLLLQAMIVSSVALGSSLALIGQAMGLVLLASIGMLAYVSSGPRELSFVKGALSIMFLPMIALMVISFVFPIGGPLGILMSAAFVLISTMGLLYQFNQVIHQLRTDMHVQGAYMITMGILVLFWNILVLLMRLQRR